MPTLNDRARSLIATSMAHFVNDGSQYVFITLYVRLFPIPTEYIYIGSLAAIQNLFSVFASPFVGKIADTSGKYGYLMAIGLSMLGIGIFGFAISVLFASGFSLFLFLIPFSIIAGLGSAFYHPLGGTVLAKTWNFSSLGRAMGINGSSGSVGRAIFPLIVVSLAVYFTIPSIASLSAACLVISFAVYRMLRKVALGEGNSRSKADTANRRTNISLRRLIPLILPLTIVSFLKGFFTFGVVNFIPEYLERSIGIGYGLELGVVFTLILAMPIFGQPLFGSIADRFGRRLTLGISIAGSSISMLVVLSSNSQYLQIIFLSAFGFFVFTGFPLLIPLATSAVPSEAATLSNSIVWGFGNVGGGAVGPLLVGVLAQSNLLGSLSASFLLAAIVSLLSIGILPFVRSSKN